MNFKPYIGHRVLKDGPKLNFRNITSIGIQVTGILDRSVTKPFESTLTLYKMWIIPFMNNRNFMKNLTVKAVWILCILINTYVLENLNYSLNYSNNYYFIKVFLSWQIIVVL